MAKINRRWARRDHGRVYVLYAKLFGSENIVAILRQAENPDAYVLEPKAMEDGQIREIIANSIEDAKLKTESIFRQYLCERLGFYRRALEDFDLDDDN